MDDEDFLDDIKDNEAEVQPEPKQEEKPAEEPKEPASEPDKPAAEQPAGETVNVQPEKPEPGFVPFGAVLDERDKRKKLEAELDTLRKSSQKPPEPVELPDQFDDNFVPALTQRFEDQLYKQSLQMSERFARSQYGEETTKAALDWAYARCETDPYFNAQVRASGDPVGHAVREYQRNQIVESVTPDDFEQFKAWKAAQADLQKPAPAQEPNVSAKQPPRSLASAPSAGPASSEPIQTDEEMFEETFARK